MARKKRRVKRGERRPKRTKMSKTARRPRRKRGPRRKTGPKKRLKPRFKSGPQEILCAGFGGQGIMFMGKLLTQAGLLASKQVTWMPSYGAEVRGGTAHSMVKISPVGIANPVVTTPTICVVMNKPSLLKFEARVKEGGVLLVNKSLIDISPKRKGLEIIKIAMTDIASKLGNVRVANMVAMGALIKKTRLFSVKTIMEGLRIVLKDDAELFSLNKKAFEKGHNLVRN